MDNHKTLRAAAGGTAAKVLVDRLDLAELLQELDAVLAGAAVKRGKKEYPADFLEAYDAMKNAGVRWRDGSTPAAAYSAWKSRIKAGATAEQMIAGARRYGAYCKALPDHPVLMAQTFFGPQERYTAEYAVPRSDLARRTGPADRRPLAPDLRRQQANEEAARILNDIPFFGGETIDAT